ncbi:MAG: ABC transporter ATP-binding protein [Candidatus Aureabacteria bacterium]|nr:ABC transporter ATP-binding protein [Candidatus Auribacterota bacterium]
MIQARDISKKFLIPHEKRVTLREHVLGFLLGRTMGFEPLHALRGISFEVHKGEFFSIIGKNGSGKSTLLKILASIYAPDSGGVMLNGTVSPFLELGIGFTPDLTARDNVFLSATVLGLRRREIEALYDDIISFAELERFQDQALKNFSSGMKVRLAFSVAFMADADILLIDEVLAVGDASFQQKCYDVFRRLKREGKTIIFVSHSMGDVKEFSDRVMLLHEGRVVSVGEPEKVIHDYQLLTAHEDEKRLIPKERLPQRAVAEQQKGFTPPSDEKRWGNGWARVTRMVLSDAAGKEKHVYATGEPLRMRIYIKRENPLLETAKVCVAIHRADGVNVLETCSDPVSWRASREQDSERSIELEFPRLELLGATYYCDVALMPEGGNEPYDFIKGCCSIRIYQDNTTLYRDFKGISYMPHVWNVRER